MITNRQILRTHIAVFIRCLLPSAKPRSTMNDYVGGLFAGESRSLLRGEGEDLQFSVSSLHVEGIASTFAVHPIDTLKVTMQCHSTHSISKAARLIMQLNSVRMYATVGFLRCINRCIARSRDSIEVFLLTYLSNVLLRHHSMAPTEAACGIWDPTEMAKHPSRSCIILLRHRLAGLCKHSHRVCLNC